MGAPKRTKWGRGGEGGQGGRGWLGSAVATDRNMANGNSNKANGDGEKSERGAVVVHKRLQRSFMRRQKNKS